MDSFYNILEIGVLIFSILSIGALSGLFSERSGVVNVAIEGLMTFGALFYAISGNIFGANNNNMQYLSLLIAGAGGALISLLFSLSAVTLKADQVISGTAINLLAGGIAIYLAINSTWSNASVIRSNYININLSETGFFSHINSFIIIAIAIIGITFAVINLTKWGLRLRACGENPQAADSAGVNVIKTRYIALLISGFLAGIAGGMFINKSANVFTGNVQGYGFISLTILIFGQWRTSYITTVGILFAGLTAFAIQSPFIKGFQDVPKDLINTVPYIISILSLIILSKRSRAPKASGQPFVKSKR